MRRTEAGSGSRADTSPTGMRKVTSPSVLVSKLKCAPSFTKSCVENTMILCSSRLSHKIQSQVTERETSTNPRPVLRFQVKFRIRTGLDSVIPQHRVHFQAGIQQEQPHSHEKLLLTWNTELGAQETSGSVTALVSDPVQATSPLITAHSWHPEYDSRLSDLSAKAKRKSSGLN